MRQNQGTHVHEPRWTEQQREAPLPGRMQDREVLLAPRRAQSIILLLRQVGHPSLEVQRVALLERAGCEHRDLDAGRFVLGRARARRRGRRGRGLPERGRLGKLGVAVSRGQESARARVPACGQDAPVRLVESDPAVGSERLDVLASMRHKLRLLACPAIHERLHTRESAGRITERQGRGGGEARNGQRRLT